MDEWGAKGKLGAAGGGGGLRVVSGDEAGGELWGVGERLAEPKCWDRVGGERRAGVSGATPCPVRSGASFSGQARLAWRVRAAVPWRTRCPERTKSVTVFRSSER